MWLELALLEQGELLAQEEVLGSQCAARPGNEHEETDEITRDEGQRVEAVCQQFEDGAGHERSALHVTRRYATANWRPGEISADHTRRAREVDPLSGLINANVVWKLYLARQYDEAELDARRISGWQPQVMGGYILASVYLQTGRQREAVAMLKKLAESHRGVLELMYLGHALGVTGARAEGQKVLEEMQGLSQRRYVPPEYIAMVYEGLGERDRALQWFEKAVAERSMNGWILPDPRLDQIRTEPRFKNLMRRMGLPQ